MPFWIELFSGTNFPNNPAQLVKETINNSGDVLLDVTINDSMNQEMSLVNGDPFSRLVYLSIDFS